MIKKIGKVIAGTIVYVAVFALIAEIVSFVFDVLGVVSRSVSGPLFYVVWAVFGILCGLLSYSAGGEMIAPESKKEWTSRKDAGRIGLQVVVIETLTLIPLSILSALLVSDSLSLTTTFFAAVFIAMLFGHISLRPKPQESA